MMKCPKCNFEAKSDALYCMECGALFDAPEVTLNPRQNADVSEKELIFPIPRRKKWFRKPSRSLQYAIWILVIFLVIGGIGLVIGAIFFPNSCSLANFPIIKDVFNLREPLFPVRMGEKWGFINKNGKMMIKPAYDAVANPNHIFELVQPAIVHQKWFSGGFQAVNIAGKWGWIDENGHLTISPQYEGALFFSEGLASVLVGLEKKVGFIDTNGAMIIQPVFSSGEFSSFPIFSDGLASVIMEGDNKKTGFINRQGKIVIPPYFDEAYWFSDGLAAVRIANKWGFINSKGDLVIMPRFSQVFWFTEGLAAVCEGNKWGFINKSGEYVISSQFDQVFWFSEGLAPVLTKSKWGFISNNGAFVIQPDFEQAFSFSENLAPVMIGLYWGYVSQNGKVAIPPQFLGASQFFDGLAQVVDKNGEDGYIDLKGTTIWKSDWKGE